MSTALANFLFEAANFLLLAAALGYVLFKPVRRALEAERERYEQQAQTSARDREQAQALLDSARQAQQQAQQVSGEQRHQLLAAARKQAAEIVEQTRQAQAAQAQALERERAAALAAEVADAAQAVGQLAAESVRRLLASLHGPSLDLALVRGACDELSAVPAAARARAVVESAAPLEAQAQALLQGALGHGFEARVVPELGAGVRITTPAGQIDASAEAIARRAAHAMAEASTSAAPSAEASHA